MLEKLADYDEHLMEELLSDVEPPRDEVFGDLSKELAEGLVVPVLMGSAEKGQWHPPSLEGAPPRSAGA